MPKSKQTRKFPLVEEWDKWVTLSQTLALDGRIPAYCKTLYWIIACYRNTKTGYSWPSLETIHTHSDLSIPTVRKYMDELEQWGLVKRFAIEGEQENIRYELQPYSQAVHLHHLEDLKVKTQKHVRKPGCKEVSVISNDVVLKQITPEPETAQNLKNRWKFHGPGCICFDCRRERGEPMQAPDF